MTRHAFTAAAAIGFGIFSSPAGCGNGGSTGADASTTQNECAKDLDCDDEVPCTKDMCVVSVNQVLACWHEPDDSRCGPLEKCGDASSPMPGCRPVAQIRCVGKADGEACDPSDPCAADKGACKAGLCEYPVKECPEVPCRVAEGCDVGSGKCAYHDSPDLDECFDGFDMCRPGLCEAGSCVAHDIDCDDGVSCTKDSCDPASGCVNEPLTGEPCEDGDLCAGPDECVAGTCVPGPAVSCDDGDACTDDSCDTGSGCVNLPLAPCCTNMVVEAGEDCDEGPDGTSGCSPTCGFAAMTLAAPPLPGRSPAVAWSQATDSGLVAFETVGDDGTLALKVVPVDAHAQAGPPVTVVEAAAKDGFQTQAPSLAALDPDGVFLLAGFGETSVDLRVLSASGQAQLQKTGAYPLGDSAPVGVVRAGAAEDFAAVAWQSLTDCPGAGITRNLSVAPVVAGPSLLLPAGPKHVLGDCESNSMGLLGGVCAGSDVIVAAVGRRTGTETHYGGYGVVPVTSTGVGEYHEIASFEGDLVQPPACVAGADGKSFMIVYMLIVTSQGGQGQTAIQIWSRFVDGVGQAIGPPTIVQSTSLDPVQGYEACLPGFASLARTGDGGYVMACPVATMDAQGSASSMVLSTFTFSSEGLLVEGPVPVEGQSEQFALAVDAAGGPGDSALVAWMGRPDAVGFDPYLPPPYWIRASFIGSF